MLAAISNVVTLVSLNISTCLKLVGIRKTELNDAHPTEIDSFPIHAVNIGWSEGDNFPEERTS